MFNKRNHIIREAKGDIPYWVIAEKLGVHENTIMNWMKKEMLDNRREKILSAIKEIKEEVRKEG
ncbi:hypothetical protein [Robertmurraya korlensis]|uniref:hypothetical protein n=1 Tax=Robertmurraya korlensis TaxID=519977 RepID=UPI000824D9A5|nr:hypothetical protein [Robertmurraya korlensis]